MARFIGTLKDFKKFIGPWAANNVQCITRNEKKNRNGKCDECGEIEADKTKFHAAHIKGRGRVQIIEKILTEKYKTGELIDCDLNDFKLEFIHAHGSINQTFRFLCQKCHKTYDRIRLLIPLKVHSNKYEMVLPITLEPESENNFKIALLRTRRAQITIYYNSGRIKQKSWYVKRLSMASGILNNLRSRPEFRPNSVAAYGIARVHVQVMG